MPNRKEPVQKVRGNDRHASVWMQEISQMATRDISQPCVALLRPFPPSALAILQRTTLFINHYFERKSLLEPLNPLLRIPAYPNPCILFGSDLDLDACKYLFQ